MSQWVLATMVILMAGCGSDESSTHPVPVIAMSVTCAVTPRVLRVDLVDEAVGAVEAAMGAEVRYFEINATELVVNLFVANDAATEVTPFVYLDNELSSLDPLPAEGATFSAASLDFDPERVTGCVAAELESSSQRAFEIVGGPDESVRYSVVVDSEQGAQLIVDVSGGGTVLSVDPV